MSEMVERVAESIDTVLSKAGGWDDGFADSKAIARAAIEAMRKPTLEMLNVGCEEAGAGQEQEVIHIWQAMIDAALGKT